MSFHTSNELVHFDFVDSVLMGIEKGRGCWHIYLSDVHILPENSQNRDIRTMRCNDLDLQLSNGILTTVVEEGYSLLDVNGKAYQRVEDRLVPDNEYEEVFAHLQESHVDEILQNGGSYILCLRDEDHTWRLSFTADQDMEDWQKFLNL